MNNPDNPVLTGRRLASVRRGWPAEAAWLIVLLLFILGLLATGNWFWQNLAAPASRQSDQKNPQTGLSRHAAAGIVERGSQLLGLGQPAAIWTERLASGQAGLGDYLLRIFTSPAYLATQAADRTFLADASRVLTGAPISDPDLDKAESRLNATGSRLAYLNQLILDLGYRETIRLPADPTRLRTLALADDRQMAGSEAVGILTFITEARLTGRDARFRLYADGRLRLSQGVAADDPNISNQYAVEWDTRRETAGRHSLALLVQTSDGRGVWLDLDAYDVPEVTRLTIGQPLAGQFASGKNAWYSLPVTDGQALLTIVDADSNLNLQMIDLYGKELATAAVVAGQPAALRSKTTAAAGQSCYVRILAPADAACQLVPALAAARPTADRERLLGVLALKNDQVLIQDEAGTTNWLPAADYRIIDTTARLSLLALTLPDGTAARYACSFSPETNLYGLVVGETTSQVTLSALTMEGSAARLQIERILESGDTILLAPGDPVPLAQSANRLRLQVTGYDGSSRAYEINILRPPHSAGYEQNLETFPDSYRSPLWLMHVQHPAWLFEAAPTGVDWAAFIAGEDVLDRSLVSADVSPASWVEAGSPVYDGKYWKAADTRIIEYFGDPRNFLNDVDVFQFERMTFNPATHSRAGIEAVLANSFMAAGNSQGIDFAGLLLTAGQTAGISPYFLAAKIIQEMGRQGESLLASASLPGYEGFYNFYNIGSTPNPSVANGALINGARFAQYGRNADEKQITAEEAVWLLPWTTPERAITGGAIWIAQRYVQIGQDTLYLQRFDLIADGSLYTHQYATNIQMAWSEARNTRKAYTGIGILDEAFLFSIPVFNKMPEIPQTLP